MGRQLPYDRAQRIADEIHCIIVSLCYNEISDPRIKGAEITAVRMTKDLQIAHVYFYIEGSDEDAKNQVRDGLKSAAGFFKRAIGAEMKLRYIPEIKFFFDETIELEHKIDSLIPKKDGNR